MKTDLIIIGSGPGGYRTADYAAKKGLKVIIFEDEKPGGTCLNAGCIPTKCFAHDATKNHVDDFKSILQRKNEVVNQLKSGVETLMSQPNITFIRSKASLKNANTVVADDEEYTARNIIIATGSHAKLPPVEGINAQESLPDGIMTSTELLNIDHVPNNLCIIGAGVIGMEFASAFNSFGSNVTIIEFLKECLPTVDGELARRLRRILEKKGIKFNLSSAVKSIKNGVVTFEKKGKEQEIEADTILIATGRGANVDGLHLDNAGVSYTKRGITVDDNMETNVKGVYAIGDVNGRVLLAHAATFQGMRAVNHILGKEDHIRFDIIPSAIFTDPEVACVGINEDEAKNQGISFTTKKGYYRANGRALSIEQTEGMVKMIVDENDKIIGCHILGAHASDLIQEIAGLMNYDVTTNRLKDIIHTHPTLGEILQDMVIE